jgi:hypothetical protein
MSDMPPTAWQYLPAIIAALFSGVAVVISALNNRKISQAAVTADATHKLVNSDHGVALRLASTTLQRIAEFTKQPIDVKAALDAKTAADNHDATQLRINQEGHPGVFVKQA